MQQIIGKMEQSYYIQKKDFNTLQYFSRLYLPQSAEKMFYWAEPCILLVGPFLLEVWEVCSLIRSAFLCLVRISLYFMSASVAGIEDVLF